jgi:hypothetical protein
MLAVTDKNTINYGDVIHHELTVKIIYRKMHRQFPDKLRVDEFEIYPQVHLMKDTGQFI